MTLNETLTKIQKELERNIRMTTQVDTRNPWQASAYINGIRRAIAIIEKYKEEDENEPF